jgi:spore coat polysaccharide biosynthesis protein SpsF
MSSDRLPGKVLMPLGGSPALGQLLDRLERAREVAVVAVATSREMDDEPIAQFCAMRGVACERGPLDDVAGRMLAAAESLRLDAFVRISGDSPLLDPAIVDAVASAMRDGNADVVTNLFPRSFPIGQSAECVRVETMRLATKEMTEPRHREHVTLWFYDNPDRLRIRNITARGNWSTVRLALDTAEDARALDALFARMDRPHTEYGWREIVELLGAT